VSEIKLIIWDLDDTLWQGTLADKEDVILKKDVVERIQFLLDRGIVHSICSKNDEKKTEKVLKKLGIYDLFIFPKISFEDKGLRIKKIIEQAQLREQNVLFVDDNPFILREVIFHNANIMTQLIDQFMQEDVTNWGKYDIKRERLAQYKILEKKENNRVRFLEKIHDEQAFLKACDISIQLIPLDINDKD
jgi:FkbH-like protein